ncbi:MAG: hypothetical protein Q8Q36_01355 [bacterium]|nr:hypothetical protein [bacterium]
MSRRSDSMVVASFIHMLLAVVGMGFVLTQFPNPVGNIVAGVLLISIFPWIAVFVIKICK